MRVAKQWNILPKETEDSPLLADFKIQVCDGLDMRDEQGAGLDEFLRSLLILFFYYSN